MGAKQVLLVDGDRDSRTVYRIVLSHHGFEVHEAADGEAALKVATSRELDVIVTELTLRRVDGHTLVEMLRKDERSRRASVLIVTARGLQEDRLRAEQAGCTRFLVKPLEPQQLVREIMDVLATEA